MFLKNLINQPDLFFQAGKSNQVGFDVFQKIVDFSELNLKLKISKWQISEVTKGINFVGYRTWENYKLIRKDSVKRAKKKIKNCLKHNDSQTLKKFLASWMGHIQWADTDNLKNKLNNLNYEIN